MRLAAACALIVALVGGAVGGAVTAAPAAAAPVTAATAVSAAAASTSPAPTPVVSGNRILDSRIGSSWTARAVNWPSFEYACQQGWAESASGTTPAAAAAMASWGVTAVRIPLNQDCWLGVDGAPAYGTPASYQAALAAWVGTLNQAGLVVILDLHWTAPAGSIANGQRAMPDAQSVTFWSQLAAAYRSSPSVLFETFNEPYSRGAFPVSWSCWLNGGCQVPRSNDQSPIGTATYTAHGQAELVAAIRAAGAAQPILLDGIDYANDLRGWLANKPNDGQLIASWHNYPGQRCQTASCWNSEIAPVAATVPVIATEFGQTDGGDGFLTSFMDWADAHGVGYAPWAWWVTDASDGTEANLYALITDLRTFTPRAPAGTAFHDHLAALGARAAATSFVLAAYTDVLHRTPDVSDQGVQWWVANILAGVPRGSIAAGFTNSDEYRRMMIAAAYTDVLHRAPEAQGADWWLAQMRAGNAQPDDAHRIFLSTAEFYQVQGGNSDAGYITALYADILNRVPEASGLAFWTAALRANGRASVVAGMWGSDETLRAQVQAAYSDLLGRSASAGDAAFWVAVVRASGPTAMRTQILASGEYGFRAITRFPQTAGVAATPPTTTPPTTPTTAPAAATFFAASSPFNTSSPAGAPVDGRSAAIVAGLTTRAAVPNLVHYGIPVYTATSSTPTARVSCWAPADWGTCPLAGKDIPLSDAFTPNDGSDGAMVVLDRTAGVAYEFWHASHGSSGWTTEWGGISSLTGSGWSGVATATGASRLGGVVLLSELQSGTIPHALAVQSSMTCSSSYRAPASKTDGTSASSSCIPAGARIQLDPSLDLSTLTLSAPELAVAKALQSYGAYVVDTGGASLSISFERAADASGDNPGAAYTALGLRADYQAFSGIPWSRLRVLAGTDLH